MKLKAHYFVLSLLSSMGQAGYMQDKLKELRAQGLPATQVFRTAPPKEQTLDYKPIADANCWR